MAPRVLPAPQRGLPLWLLTALIIGGAGCSNPLASGITGVLTNLRFTPSAFDSFRRNTELRFTLESPQTLSIVIAREDSGANQVPVRTLLVNARETKGSHSTTWLGDNNSGTFAPSGMYLGVVTIGHESFSTSVQVFHF
jgi:hypothetical protein